MPRLQRSGTWVQSLTHIHDHGPPRKRALSVCPLPYQKHWQNQEIPRPRFVRENCPCLRYISLGPEHALLAGLPGDTVAKLQKCQNIAARVLTRTRIRDHIKPVLVKLHWLPVEQRIQYKLLIQVYKALNGLAPEYIADLLHEYVPTRSLRSAGAHLLFEPKTTTRWGARAFSNTAPVLWNTLPSTIKAAASLACFKIGLKTFIYLKQRFYSRIHVNNACRLLTFIYLFI